jgi:cyanophycinase
MNRHLLLEGGAEFGGKMSEPDLRAIELAGGVDSLVCIIPTAAAPDGNHKHAGEQGVRWFQKLGVKNVFPVNVIDPASANDPALADSIRAARLIYLLGGFPRYLGETLANSLCWHAALEAHEHGAVIAGSSAGAMVLCEHYHDPYEQTLLRGLNLIPNACVIPHHNNFGKAWSSQLLKLLPNAILIGIDERTGALTHSDTAWKVYGAGHVTIYRNEKVEVYKNGERFALV